MTLFGVEPESVSCHPDYKLLFMPTGTAKGI